MIDLYYWPTPNGWKITIFLEESGTPYRVVRDLYVLPSKDLAVMAAECLETHRSGAGIRACTVPNPPSPITTSG